MPSLTIIADANISHLDDYFNADVLGSHIRLIQCSGRDINASLLHTHQPDALLIRSVTAVDANLLANNHSVKFVGSATIGVDHVDVDYLQQRHIGFANASGCSKHSVAQYVITAILTLHPAYRHSNITLGIIGLGNIGSCLQHYANCLGWQVLAYDPFLPQKTQVKLNQLLASSDVISLHVPLTHANTSKHPTHHLIDANAFAAMQAHTLLINTARGQVVDEQALLVDRQYSKRQVVLDVFEKEPVVSAEVLNNLAIATPHIAGYTLEGKLKGTHMIYCAFCQHFGLPSKQTLDNLLPSNPWKFTHLLQAIENNELQDCLLNMYDIMADDAMLRRAKNAASQQVDGQDFDALRKNYQLRREWL